MEISEEALVAHINRTRDGSVREALDITKLTLSQLTPGDSSFIQPT